MLERLHEHVMAENAQEEQDKALGHYIWEYHTSGMWRKFTDADQIAIEAERRGGRPGPTLTFPGGQRCDSHHHYSHFFRFGQARPGTRLGQPGRNSTSLEKEALAQYVQYDCQYMYSC